ncbi:MAG: DISARM system phospholipase D-like protein DrmC [Chloroflexi bacterium]|nr:DISARM system phospholipase D-like protein DrmC [Chloroflexota bacterium]MCI0728409.1 DISARM system phospholipase D-like protein DrmC [Chloroflexota bacterium]
MSYQPLAHEIHRLVQDMPDEFVTRVAEVLLQAEAADWRWLRWQTLNAVAQPELRERLGRFLDFWQSQAADVPPASVAMGMLTAAQAENHHRRQQQLELVWTGPDSEIIPLRRTDQALLQLINEAQHTLHIVSFAVYKAQTITTALVSAAHRHVAIAIYLETPNASEGKISFDTIGALGQEIAHHARLYVWPLSKRPATTGGRRGALHAKIALADGRTLLISSANLTEYAMTLNMEMGILVRGGPLPGQVEKHLARLIEQGDFKLV